MVVPVSQLGRLVRQTAIHASKLATAPPPLPPTPPSAGLATGNGSGKSGFHAAQGSVISSAMQGHQYHQASPSISAIASGGANSGPGQSTSTIGASITSLVTSGIAGVSLSSGANGHGFGTNGSTSSSMVAHGSIGGGTGTSQMAAFANGHPFKQRAQAIEQISKRHKMEKWTFQQFMEQVFGYSTSKLQHR